MRRTPWRAVSLVLVLSLALMSCDGPNRGANTQPSSVSGFLVVVTATPNVLRNEDTAVITVTVTDRQGRLVDGATVTVTASPADAGVNTVVGVTTRGFFTTTYRVENVPPGTAIITAVVEDAVATTLITITA
ncbi:MAG: hypothetical protein ACRELA_03195 [Candidatus Rokuibacteriota bacterium]